MIVTEGALAILLAAALVTSIISGMMGMAGGILLLVVIASTVPTIYVIPLFGCVQLVSNLTRLSVFYRHIQWKIIRYFLIGVVPGSVIGIYVFSLVPREIIKPMIALFILLILYLPKPQRRVHLLYPSFIVIGLVGGILGILLGTPGPFLAVFFYRNDILKEELIATKAACQAISHALKIPFFGFLGANLTAYWDTLLYLSVAVVFGTMIGKKLLRTMSEKTFMVSFKFVLTLLSLRVILLEALKICHP
jgi:uncharacterized membrane protein YfcA